MGLSCRGNYCKERSGAGPLQLIPVSSNKFRVNLQGKAEPNLAGGFLWQNELKKGQKTWDKKKEGTKRMRNSKGNSNCREKMRKEEPQGETPMY